jgi:hypothetical protein
MMKIYALTRESPAPVAKVYIPHIHIIKMERAALIFLLLPSTAVVFDRIPYVIPR